MSVLDRKAWMRDSKDRCSAWTVVSPEASLQCAYSAGSSVDPDECLLKTKIDDGVLVER